MKKEIRFTRLDIRHKQLIEQYVRDFKPYSDFNFISLYSWSAKAPTSFAIVNNNLVIKMLDYTTDAPIYSIIGHNEISQTIKLLLTQFPKIDLVPEEVVSEIGQRSAFAIVEDHDNHDYVYAVSDLVEMPGKKYKVKRNKNNYFLRSYNENLEVRKVNFSSAADRRRIMNVARLWAKQKHNQTSITEAEREKAAIKKLLGHAHQLNVFGILVFVEGRCIGFSLNEIVDDLYAVCHFQKTLINFEHVDVFISHLAAQEIKHFGCQYINWEQDLGIEGLREHKSSYHPYEKLKKYTVSLVK